MRRKNWKNPGRVYVDSQVFEENIQVYASFEVFLEILEGLIDMCITIQSYYHNGSLIPKVFFRCLK